MRYKRLLSSFAVMAIIAMMFRVTAFAENHSYQTPVKRVPYSVCTVEGCNLTYDHTHNGKYYYGHALADGHNFHQLCAVEDCTILTTHTHDGATYFAHNLTDGHDYHDDWHYRGDGHNYHSTGHAVDGHH